MDKKTNEDKREELDSTSYYRKTGQTKHDFYYFQNPHEYGDPLMEYMGLKNVLLSIDDIKNVRDKRRIRKTLDMISELGFTGERVGRIGDYGGMRADLYKIAEHLSEAKYGNGKPQQDFFDLALKYKKSLLDKVEFREKQLRGEIPRFDWMNPNNISLWKNSSKVAALMGVILGALFLIPNKISGAVISEASTKSNPVIGIVLLFIGLISGIFLFKFRNFK